jgi:UDP-N-acetylglucosamine 2-epimerase
MIEVGRGWSNPFGDGRAGERIVKIISNNSWRRRLGYG